MSTAKNSPRFIVLPPANGELHLITVVMRASGLDPTLAMIQPAIGPWSHDPNGGDEPLLCELGSGRTQSETGIRRRRGLRGARRRQRSAPAPMIPRTAETARLHRAHEAPSASNNASSSASPHGSAMTTPRRSLALPK